MKVDLYLTNPINKKFDINTNTVKFIGINTDNNDLSKVYYRPLSFNGISSHLEKLTNIHCPHCNVKMLTKEQFSELMKKAGEIKSKEDFFSLLNDNIEYAQPIFEKIIYNLNKLDKACPDKTLSDIFAMTRKGASKNLENVLNAQIETLKNISQDTLLPESDRQILSDCAEKMGDAISIKDTGVNKIANILHETFSQMQFSDKWDMYNSIKTAYIKAYVPRSVLKFSNPDENIQAKSIIENIYKNSVSKVNKINDSITEDLEANTILLCSNCSKDKTKTIKNIMNVSNPKIIESYNNYLDDVSSKILTDDSCGITPNYVRFLHGIVKRISKGNITMKSTENISRIKVKLFEDRSQLFDFNLTKHSSIPCACCGKDTITHDEKLQIFDEIFNAKNKQEILAILNKHKDIIRNYYTPFVDLFQELLTANPNISDKEIFVNLQNLANEKINRGLVRNEIFVKDFVLLQKLNKSDTMLAKEYLANSADYKCIIGEEPQMLKWAEYKSMLNNTIGKMESKNTPKFMDRLKRNIKGRFRTSLAVYPVDSTVQKFNNPIKVVAQEIIKQSVATTDHIVPLFKKGPNEMKNLLVLCKCCNQSKNSKSANVWMNDHPAFKKNINKYFEVIKSKIESGELDASYVNYLKELKTHIIEITRGRLNIEYNPNL
mgnify:CR=1 FL=1